MHCTLNFFRHQPYSSGIGSDDGIFRWLPIYLIIQASIMFDIHKQYLNKYLVAIHVCLRDFGLGVNVATSFRNLWYTKYHIHVVQIKVNIKLCSAHIYRMPICWQCHHGAAVIHVWQFEFKVVFIFPFVCFPLLFAMNLTSIYFRIMCGFLCFLRSKNGNFIQGSYK